jgi:hypothetical protein
MTLLDSTLGLEDRAEFTSKVRAIVPLVARHARRLAAAFEAADVCVQRGDELTRDALRGLYRGSVILELLDDHDRRNDLHVFSGMLLGQWYVAADGAWEQVSAEQAERVLAQATRVAQSAALTRLDWSREPLTDRERRARERWIQRKMATHMGRWNLASKACSVRLEHGRIGNDLAAAVAVSDAMLKQESAERERRELEALVEEIDAEDNCG